MNHKDIKVGDVLRIRSWESMQAEFGFRCDGNINVPGACFNIHMREHCGKKVTVEKLGTMLGMTTIRFKERLDGGWTFTSFMVEPAEKVIDGVIFEVADSSDRFTVKQVENGKVIIEGSTMYKKTARKPVVEMTVAEIEEKLGVKNLKVVKG